MQKKTCSGWARAVIQPLQEEVIKRKAEDGWAEISSLPPAHLHKEKNIHERGNLREISVRVKVEAGGAFWVRLVNKSEVLMQMIVYIYSLGNGVWIRTVMEAHPGTRREITSMLSEPIGMRFRWLTLSEQTGFQDWHEVSLQ